MEYTKTLAELLEPKLTELGIKITLDPNMDSDAVFLIVNHDKGSVCIANPKMSRTPRGPDQFDFNELLKPDKPTQTLKEAIKELDKHLSRPQTGSQNYLQLKKGKYK